MSPARDDLDILDGAVPFIVRRGQRVVSVREMCKCNAIGEAAWTKRDGFSLLNL